MTTAPAIGGNGRPRPTQCIHGHPFDEQNTYIKANGTRRCRACHHDRNARYEAHVRAGTVQHQDGLFSDDPPELALAAAITRQALDDFARDPDDESAIAFLFACGLIRENGRLHARLAAWKPR